MFVDYTQVGDRVVVEMDREARKWGRKGPPDGTRGTIVGYTVAVFARGHFHSGSQKAGVYSSRGCPIVLFDGTVSGVECSDIVLVNKKTYNDRLDANRDERNCLRTVRNDTYVGRLPKTDFLELDRLRTNSSDSDWLSNKEVTVRDISWSMLDRERDDGSPYPIYNIDLPEGGSTSISASQAVLIRRGPVWAHLNGEKFEFGSVQEEASFHKQMGWTEEIRNSEGLYRWTVGEAVNEIRCGRAHGMSVSNFFGSQHLSLIRFTDEELGQQVRQTTIEGFHEGVQ